jgi:hypothetical protein
LGAGVFVINRYTGYVGEQNQGPTDPELKSKQLSMETDRNRIEFLRTELQASFTFAKVAETEHSTGEHEHAARSLADAEKAYSTLLRFMSDPKHARHISEEERLELTTGMERLRATLDRLASQQ